MAYQRKYRKGALITSIADLADQEIIYCNDKITHRGWFQSWQLSYAMRMIARQALFRAEEIKR